ncbi:hypothetical protein HYPSUDRAFT_39050 [Hypholoma sublateritium FD-334 SS-4]|uniref:Uncharacterized protein n=1 Tax=Hypholoma sublateritium (strain FD-334 SS-4) TaxID=945553 RepID=A0A0D2PF83_HYPSF|nr:hypothetical protein HYPSUDRAFT_44836 [Hypholoma sublateritium FD-334 SS-4]KJA24277.1 hypothetical protein HYPSUDRAFT_39050 [Hypholoma sublateritium FD-334 SS-4]
MCHVNASDKQWSYLYNRAETPMSIRRRDADGHYTLRRQNRTQDTYSRGRVIGVLRAGVLH